MSLPEKCEEGKGQSGVSVSFHTPSNRQGWHPCICLAPMAGRSSFAALNIYECLEKLGMINLWNEQLFHSTKMSLKYPNPLAENASLILGVSSGN